MDGCWKGNVEENDGYWKVLRMLLMMTMLLLMMMMLLLGLFESKRVWRLVESSFVGMEWWVFGLEENKVVM